MIIKKVTIRNWRGLESFEAELSSDLNIVRGRNEAGKSSVVEALSWALQRDLVGGPRVREDILSIIPAGNPKAKPCVELLLEFPDCTATIRKTLSEDSSGRECCLIIRRAGQADQSCDQAAAQNELRRLMASDGALEHAGGAVDAALLVSAQGQSTHFVGQELSSAARSSIALGADGAIAPTSRLEKVRVALEKKRNKELFERLKTNAVDAAKKTSEAARVRDELADLREQHAKYSEIETQIATLRAQIKSIVERYAVVAPRAESVHQQWQQSRERQSAQILADREVAEKRRAHEEAKTQRDTLQRRVEDLMQLRAASTRAHAEWQQLQGQLDGARDNAARTKEEVDETWRVHESSERNWRAAREQLQAWDRYLEVCAASRERKRRREVFEEQEKQAAEIAAQESVLENLGRAPSRPQLNRWREVWSQIENSRVAASQTLKISVQPERDVEMKFRADGGKIQNMAALPGEETTFGAQANAALNIAGIGTILISSAGREAQKQSAELDVKTRALEKDMAPFRVALSDLPQAFEKLEQWLAAFESASQQLQFMRQAQSHQGRSTPAAPVEELRADLEEAEAEYSRAREACEPFRALLPEGVKAAQANIERERARNLENQKQQDAERARRAWNAAMARHNEDSQTETALTSRLQSLEQTRAQHATRIMELENDGLDEAERARQLDALNENLWRVKGARDEAITRREAMGAVVTNEVLARLEREAKELREEQHRLEKEVGAKRAELRMHCEQDPQTEMERLEFEITAREQEIEKHEARLRGVAILEGALEAERHRLGRAIAGPLNEYLSPWLSELREKPTRVEFDENTGRIMGVQTQTTTPQGVSTHVLPFASHSGGMQEQTALALRLILAQAAAKKLKSRKLPLILDDPLTQSDTNRRAGLWRVLREASQYLQIVFVTCHETHLTEAIEANFVTLGAWKEAELAPIVAAEEKTKSSRAKKIKTQTNGHTPEKVETDSLALW
jgi:recombinational DNA repair ATPase RecF